MNAQLLAEGLDFSGVIEVLKNNQHLLDSITFRTSFPDSPHREVHDVILRCPTKIDADIINDKFCENYEAMSVFGKSIYPYISELMYQVGAVGLGRVILTALEPGKQVYPHEDQGAACDYYHRFHLVLQAYEGCVLKVDGEEFEQHTGQVWWFDNSKNHSVVNNSDQVRVVLIVDLELMQFE